MRLRASPSCMGFGSLQEQCGLDGPASHSGTVLFNVMSQ
jgi:hypothetical protein